MLKSIKVPSPTNNVSVLFDFIVHCSKKGIEMHTLVITIQWRYLEKSVGQFIQLSRFHYSYKNGEDQQKRVSQG